MNQDEFNDAERESKLRMELVYQQVQRSNKAMEREYDWVRCFDEAHRNAFVYGTGFIKITVNSPKGLELSVVNPEHYYLIQKENDDANGNT
jgi:sRNA-binding carbon storage regulator CsrA